MIPVLAKRNYLLEALLFFLQSSAKGWVKCRPQKRNLNKIEHPQFFTFSSHTEDVSFHLSYNLLCFHHGHLEEKGHGQSWRGYLLENNWKFGVFSRYKQHHRSTCVNEAEQAKEKCSQKKVKDGDGGTQHFQI